METSRSSLSPLFSSKNTVANNRFLLVFGLSPPAVPPFHAKGSWFGEIALLLQGTTRTATVRTATAVMVYRLDKADFVCIAQKHPALRERLARVANERLQLLRSTQAATTTAAAAATANTANTGSSPPSTARGGGGGGGEGGGHGGRSAHSDVAIMMRTTARGGAVAVSMANDAIAEFPSFLPVVPSGVYIYIQTKARKSRNIWHVSFFFFKKK